MSALELIAKHILSHLTTNRPLFVALQGPQGSGKSYISARLQSYLQDSPHSLRVTVFSIDDLYLPHEDLVALAASNGSNVLLKGRGQPGTHDVDLGVRILSALKIGNGTVELPRFDKSLFNGDGDRLPLGGNGLVVKQPPPVDVVLFEGWCVGFHPLSSEKLLSLWNGVWKVEQKKLGIEGDQLGTLVDIQAVNNKLKDYIRLWKFFDLLVQLKPETPNSTELSQYAIVYGWRLEQEHTMKANNGGRGMSDEAVKLFVDRYIPGYVFFGYLPQSGDNWEGKGLTVTLNANRIVTGTSEF